MKRLREHTWLIIIVFIISRLVYGFFGIHFEYDVLYKYWQYLDVETLQHDLLRGVWYNHAQPPFFNLFLGVVLKITGSFAPHVFAAIFKLITLINAFLIYALVKRLTNHSYLPIILSLLYLLSPASMIFENELFYTTFISMLLLVCSYNIVRFHDGINWQRAIGVFLPLLIICLTRSMYHLAWLFVISLVILVYCKRRPGLKKLIVASVFCFLLTGSWYVKNYLVFGNFSTSSWVGMNLARNVFHDVTSVDSSRIESIPPFSRISAYKPFITGDYEKKYAGLNDRDLLTEMKNDTNMSQNHISYIEVSQKYMEACKKEIKAHPGAYLKNVLQSSIIFFAPATRYPVTEPEARKIRYYDLVYSFNLSHFALGKQERRIALTISALPKFLIYFFVFFIFLRDVIRKRQISLLNLLILLTIAYVFTVSSLLEHYENMRFRFETEPLFLVLLGQMVNTVIQKKRAKT